MDIDISSYENYSIKEFIQLYKLGRLYVLGIISESEYDNLRELIDIRKEISIELGKEVLKKWN